MTELEFQEKPMDLKDFTVLIVEDYPFIASILAASLMEMGVGNVLIAENGVFAKTKINSYNNFETDRNIDLVVLDWLMPKMDGREFLKWMRSNQKDTIRFLPVIVCSAYASEIVVTESRDLGANEVIVKPVSAAEVSRRIQYVINKPRAFVKGGGFFGPDRRRKKVKIEGEERRKIKPEDIQNVYERK